MNVMSCMFTEVSVKTIGILMNVWILYVYAFCNIQLEDYDQTKRRFLEILSNNKKTALSYQK